MSQNIILCQIDFDEEDDSNQDKDEISEEKLIKSEEANNSQINVIKDANILEEKMDEKEKEKNDKKEEVIEIIKEVTIKKEDQKDTSTEEISSDEIIEEKSEDSKKDGIIIKLDEIEIKKEENEKDETKKVEENETGKINLKNNNVIIPESKIIEIIKDNPEKNESNSSELKIIEKNEILLDMNKINEENQDLIVSSNQIENTEEKIQELNCGNLCLNLPGQKLVKEKEQNQKVNSDIKEKNKVYQKKELNISKQTNSFKNKINNQRRSKQHANKCH